MIVVLLWGSCLLVKKVILVEVCLEVCHSAVQQN